MLKNPCDDFIICGLDEAGRGPLAGPVYASAVVFKRSLIAQSMVQDTQEKLCGCGDEFLQLLNDSKKLSARSREKAFDAIIANSFYAISFASHEEIDELNILQASLLAMARSFSLVYAQIAKEAPQLLANLHVIIDGNKVPHFAEQVSCEAMVKADAKVREVMAASILAKVARDRKMIEYSRLYPQWQYEKHKGYPTKAHIEAIRQWGISPIQRKSFKYKL